MQQNQSERRFSDSTPQQPVYRFPQNQTAQGYQPQQTYYTSTEPMPELTPKDKRDLKKAHRKPRKRRFSLLWNLFAIIGVVTVLVQAARYLVIPLLVYLKTLSGGAL